MNADELMRKNDRVVAKLAKHLEAAAQSENPKTEVTNFVEELAAAVVAGINVNPNDVGRLALQFDDDNRGKIPLYLVFRVIRVADDYAQLRIVALADGRVATLQGWLTSAGALLQSSSIQNLVESSSSMTNPGSTG